MSKINFGIVTLEDAKKFYRLRLMKKSLLAFQVVLLLNFGAFAQSRDSVQPNGPKTMLTGVVYDINGAVVVDTLIVAYNKDGKKYETATNDEGVYQVELPLALYKIEVGAHGFCPAQVDGFRTVNSTYGKMSLDFVLEVAGSKEGCKYKSILDKKSKRPTNKKPKLIAE
jgi:hypothetical protein